MSFGKTLMMVGLVLIIVAWLLAAGMPEAADRDFGKLVAARGGSMSHSPSFPDEYRKRWRSLGVCFKTPYLA